MGDYNKGELGSYTVTPETAQRFNLTEGDELVFLPTNVDEAGTASGLAFTTEGFYAVTIPAPEPEPVTDPNAKPDGVSTADWSAFQDFQAHRNDPPATNATAQPVSDSPAPTEDGPATSTTPSPFTFTTGPNAGDTTTDTSENGDTK